MHPVQRRRHRRAQVGAVVVPVGQPQSGDPALAGVGRLDPGDAVCRGAGGRQMLQPILDPLDRPSGLAGQDAQHHDVGKDGQLGAEAAAGVPGAAKTQAVGAGAQRPHHDRMQREGALKVGKHVETAGLGDGPRDDRVGFHGGDGIARIGDGHLRCMIGPRECLVRRSVYEVARGYAIGVGLRMQQRRVRLRCLDRIDDGRERPVLDLDRVEGVFGKVTVGGGDHRDRLADVADPAHRHAVVVDGVAETHDHGIGLARHVLAGHDRMHAGHLQCLRTVDGKDFGVWMGRAEKGGVQRSRPDRQVVDEFALANQERTVLGAQHAAADVPVAGPYPFRQREIRHRAVPAPRSRGHGGHAGGKEAGPMRWTGALFRERLLATIMQGSGPGSRQPPRRPPPRTAAGLSCRCGPVRAASKARFRFEVVSCRSCFMAFRSLRRPESR